MKSGYKWLAGRNAADRAAHIADYSRRHQELECRVVRPYRRSLQLETRILRLVSDVPILQCINTSIPYCEMQKGEWTKQSIVMMTHHVVISKVWNRAEK